MTIQWGRIILAAFIMEVALFAIAVPLFMSGHGAVNFYVIPPASLVLTYVVTVWIGRGFKSRFSLQGALVGVVGTLMYVALTRGQPEAWQYLLAHALKVVGGVSAGWALERRRTISGSGTAIGPART